MKKYIKCPHCGHKSITVFGVVIKMFSKYELFHGYFGSFRHITKGRESYWPKWKDVKKAKGICGYYCKRCKKLFPQEMNDKISDYIERKLILMKLQK